MLPELRFNATHRNIGELSNWLIDVDGDSDYFPINLNPDYQRQPVWNDDKSRGLIKSLLMGLPIGVLFINHLVDKPGGDTYMIGAEMIDGQQRARALVKFVTGDLAIPTSWIDNRDWVKEQNAKEQKQPAGRDGRRLWYAYVADDYTAETITYEQLTIVGQRHFRNKTVQVYETHYTSQQAAELYLLINFGGVPQTDADRENAQRVARS